MVRQISNFLAFMPSGIVKLFSKFAKIKPKKRQVKPSSIVFLGQTCGQILF